LTPYIAAEIGTESEEKYWSQSAEVELLWSFHVLLTSIVQMTQSSQCIYLHATSDVLLTSISGVSENNFCTICYPVEWWSCQKVTRVAWVPSISSSSQIRDHYHEVDMQNHFIVCMNKPDVWWKHISDRKALPILIRILKPKNTKRMHLTYQRYLTLQNSSRYSNK
jgi:hypothetical protein